MKDRVALSSSSGCNLGRVTRTRQYERCVTLSSPGDSNMGREGHTCVKGRVALSSSSATWVERVTRTRQCKRSC